MSDTRKDSAEVEPGGVALVLVDVINDLEFDGGEELFERALPAAERLERLIARCREAKLPVVYANDNFGYWRDDFRALMRHCLHDDVRGKPIAERLRPHEDDYFVLKPRHSGFYATPLEHLLDHLEIETMILAGFATDQCVLLTAADAHMRDYRVVVPTDCSAAESDERHRAAIEWIERVADADVRPAAEIDLEGLGKADTLPE